MKLSIFKNSYSVWVDYSNREDCIEVIDATQEEIEKLNSWYLYIDWEFIETPEVLENLKKIKIQEYKELEKQATDKRAEYLTAELLPEWSFRDLKLAKLEKEWDEIKANYEAMITELIEKYWGEILNELI